MNQIKKLTKVQESVMARFAEGQRLVCLPTNRMSGEVLFWVKQFQNDYYERGVHHEEMVWDVVEKALYPQLRRLFWSGMVSEKNSDQFINPSGIEWAMGARGEFHREGVIGF